MMMRRAAVLGVVAVLVLAACGGSSSKNHRAGVEPAAPNTAWNQVLAQVGPNGEVSKDTALQAFALAFGGMPGVQVPSGPAGTGTDPSEALRWTLSYSGQLSPEQRVALDRVLAGAPGGGPGKARHADGPNTAKYRVLVDSAIAQYTPLIGALPISTDVQLVAPDAQNYAYVYAQNAAHGLTGQVASCRIGITPIGQKKGDAELALYLKHEVFHCYQAAWVGSLDRYYSVVDSPSWVIEGSATWAELNLDSGPISDADNWWFNYFRNPTRPLFARTYDAIGFFGQVAQFTDVWANLKPFMQASGSEARYGILATKGGDAFVDSWGSGFFRRDYLGASWTVIGKHVPTVAEITSPFDTPTVANGSTTPVKAAAYALGLASFQPTADVVHLAITGHARFADKAGVDTTQLADAYFCSAKSGSCPCPAAADGTPPPLTAVPVKGFLSLALTGAQPGASGVVEGLSLDDFCKRTPKKAGPCGLLDQQVVKQATGLDTKPGVERQMPDGKACVWATDTTVNSPFAGIPQAGGGVLPGPTTKASVSLLVRDVDGGGADTSDLEQTSDVTPTPLAVAGAGQALTVSGTPGGSQTTAIVVAQPKGQAKVIVMFVFGATPGVSGATLLAQTAVNRF